MAASRRPRRPRCSPRSSASWRRCHCLTAILVGCRGLGRAGSWLLQGAIAVAAAELLTLLLPEVFRAVAGPTSADPTTESLVVRSLAVQVPVIVVTSFGLAKLGLGLTAIEDAERPLGRGLLAALVVGLALVLLSDALSIRSMVATPGQTVDSLVLVHNLVVVVGAMAILGLWALVVAVAARRDGRSWRLIEFGALAIVLGYVCRGIASILALQWAGPDDALTILIWFGLGAAIVGALGSILLLLGFGRGFDPLEAGAPSASPSGGLDPVADVPVS